MPSKYVVRNFQENGYYHIYNRGVEKRLTFLDNQDYEIYLYYLFVYCAPLEKVLIKYPELPLKFYSKNLSKEIDVLAYCLMPNHFHLLLRQSSVDGISKLMKRLTNAYTIYFNNKYKRVGSLFQGTFKAVSIMDDKSLYHLSRYIHLNPVVDDSKTNLMSYQWSSLKYYLTDKNSWCNTSIINAGFKSPDEYLAFLTDHLGYARSLASLKHSRIDE